MILPAQDLLGYGSDCKMNSPGVAKGNWEYRLSPEGFDRLDAAVFKELSDLYAR